MVAAGLSASQGDGDGPGICLGDGQTETPGKWIQQRAAPAHAPIPDLTTKLSYMSIQGLFEIGALNAFGEQLDGRHSNSATSPAGGIYPSCSVDQCQLCSES